MKLVVEEGMFELFPEVKIALMHGKIFSEKDGAREKILSMRKVAEEKLVKRMEGVGAITELPEVSCWREAYKQFGVKAKKHKPTHEALARRILSDKGWPDIGTIVDVYLTNQMFHLLPHGGYDLVALKGDLVLTVTSQEENFLPIGADAEEPTNVGEVVYKDDDGVITRRWNYKDCERTCIKDNTSEFILMIESPSSEISEEMLEAAGKGLCERYADIFEGEFKSGVFTFNKDNMMAEF